jgi:hypothetical protein
VTEEETEDEETEDDTEEVVLELARVVLDVELALEVVELTEVELLSTSTSSPASCETGTEESTEVRLLEGMEPEQATQTRNREAKRIFIIQNTFLKNG